MYSASTTAPTGAATGGFFGFLRRTEAWLDDRGKGAWIAAMVLGFIFVPPLGFALLAYMIWSNRMFSRYSCAERRARHFDRHMGGHWGQHHSAMRPSGNAAFDAYKLDMLKRLEDEQMAFEAFLQRLREAKDKSEFDNFMDDRARTASAPVVVEPQQPAAN